MSSCAEIEKRTEKSSFSVTCNLFSQYIKEKGFPADLSLEMTSRSMGYLSGKREACKVPITLSLLPGFEISADDKNDIRNEISVQNATRSKDPEKSKSQLTIFYGGKVVVFDDFPAEKAEVLMQLASKSSGMVLAPADSPANHPPRPRSNFSDLPIARKASLHRFLQKRRDRINAKPPYQMGINEGIKSDQGLKQEENSQPWLGLGSQISS